MEEKKLLGFHLTPRVRHVAFLLATRLLKVQGEKHIVLLHYEEESVCEGVVKASATFRPFTSWEQNCSLRVSMIWFNQDIRRGGGGGCEEWELVEVSFRPGSAFSYNGSWPRFKAGVTHTKALYYDAEADGSSEPIELEFTAHVRPLCQEQEERYWEAILTGDSLQAALKREKIETERAARYFPVASKISGVHVLSRYDAHDSGRRLCRDVCEKSGDEPSGFLRGRMEVEDTIPFHDVASYKNTLELAEAMVKADWATHRVEQARACVTV